MNVGYNMQPFALFMLEPYLQIEVKASKSVHTSFIQPGNHVSQCEGVRGLRGPPGHVGEAGGEVIGGVRRNIFSKAQTLLD